MIDWITCRVVMNSKPLAGKVMAVDADGGIEWITEKRLQVVGSWEQSVSVRTLHDGKVEFSGSPAKFLQGHNVFGSDDLQGLVSCMVRAACVHAGLTLTLDELAAIDAGDVELSRVDITKSWDFTNRKRAIAAVQALAEMSTLKHRGRGSLIGGSTATFSGSSRRSSLKAYAKGPEMDVHKIRIDLPGHDLIRQHAEGLVRFEYTLRGLELKRLNLHILKHWQQMEVTPAQLHATIMENLTISDTDMPDTQDACLPPRFQGVWQAWRDGNDTRLMFAKRMSFYRYRKAILAATGCDIATKRPPRAEQANSCHVLRVVLVGRPVDVPAWALNTSAYFVPLAA